MEKDKNAQMRLGRAAMEAWKEAGIDDARPPRDPPPCKEDVSEDVCSAESISKLCSEYADKVKDEVQTRLVSEMRRDLRNFERLARFAKIAVGLFIAAVVGLLGLIVGPYRHDWQLYAVDVLMCAAALIFLVDIVASKVTRDSMTWTFGIPMPLCLIEDALWHRQAAASRTDLIAYREKRADGSSEGIRGRSHCTNECLGRQARWLLGIAEAQVKLAELVPAFMAKAAEEIYNEFAPWIVRFLFFAVDLAAAGVVLKYDERHFWAPLFAAAILVAVPWISALALLRDRAGEHWKALGSRRNSERLPRLRHCLVRCNSSPDYDLDEVDDLIEEAFDPNSVRAPARLLFVD
jgi:hypothetical protein